MDSIGVMDSGIIFNEEELREYINDTLKYVEDEELDDEEMGLLKEEFKDDIEDFVSTRSIKISEAVLSIFRFTFFISAILTSILCMLLPSFPSLFTYSFISSFYCVSSISIVFIVAIYMVKRLVPRSFELKERFADRVVSAVFPE